MKPFDLKRAMAGDKVQTVSGIPVMIVNFSCRMKHFSIHAVSDIDGTRTNLYYTKDGKYNIDGEPSRYDLRMVN